MSDSRSWPLIIAHRGNSVAAPENTLAAFTQAIEAGAEGVEFDVRLARDRVPVVVHDATLKRTGRTDRAVSDLTSAELGKIDVGSWFVPPGRLNGSSRRTYRSEYVPTLEAVLEHLKDLRGPTFVELKCTDRELEPLTEAVCELVRSSNLAPQVIIKSFKLAVIPQVRMRAPEIRTAALFAPKIMSLLRKEKHLVKIAAEFGAHELSIHYSLATRKLMEKAGQRGLPVTVWTANSPRWVKKGRQLGLRSIITNDPEKMLARRNSLARED